MYLVGTIVLLREMLCFLVLICLLNLVLAYLLVAVGCRSRLGRDGKGGGTLFARSASGRR